MPFGLQDFSHEETDNGETVTDVNQESTESTSDDGDYESLLRGLFQGEGVEQQKPNDGVQSDEPAQTEEDPQNESTDEPTQEEADEKPWKNETNARNAQRRRDNEAYKQRIVDEYRQKAPEVQLAEQLAQMYGTDVNTLLAKAQEAQVAQLAKQQGIPVQVMQQQMALQQQIAEMQQRNLQYEYREWERDVVNQFSQLKKDYPVLTDDDLNEAKEYAFTQLRNVELPMEQVVMALHGRKIMESSRKSEYNNALAEASGRMNQPTVTGQAPQNIDSGLTDAQKAAAKALGLSEADYKKWM